MASSARAAAHAPVGGGERGELLGAVRAVDPELDAQEQPGVGARIDGSACQRIKSAAGLQREQRPHLLQAPLEDDLAEGEEQPRLALEGRVHGALRIAGLAGHVLQRCPVVPVGKKNRRSAARSSSSLVRALRCAWVNGSPISPTR